MNDVVTPVTAEDAPRPDATTTDNDQKAVSETADTPKDEQADAAKPEAEDVPFPKKAVNAINRRDRELARLRAERKQWQTEREQWQQQQPKAPTQNVLNEADFDTYGDYLEAKTRIAAEEAANKWLAANQKEQLEQQRSQQQTAWKEQRETYVAGKVETAIKEIPGFQAVLQENIDLIEAMPDHLEALFLQAEEPILAFHVLAKEGKLESLLNMTPAQAAFEIGKAELRGAEVAKAPPISKAPAPMKPAGGTGSGSKSVDRMTYEELRAWRKS